MTVNAQWTSEKKGFLASQGHVLALGGPGAGKTHVALVKARQEIEAAVLKPGQKILFLSFARPTVARILEKARELIPKEALSHLEISTYHGFAWSVLRSHGYLMGSGKAIDLLPPPEAAAHLASFPSEARATEIRRLFDTYGKLHFDLFARLVAELFQRSNSIAHAYCDSYPLVILDEFQDTNADEWAMIQQVGKRSRLIALGDPEQRIYEFRGADPNRLLEFVNLFSPERFDFAGENHRSNGTDITSYGNDLLTGDNRRRAYNDVAVVRYGFYANRQPHFPVKVEAINAMRRLKKHKEWSLAILVPSKRLMLQVSDYLSASADKLPAITHDVAMDAEAPALAAALIGGLLDGGADKSFVATRLVTSVHTHIRGRNGGKPPPQNELQLADAIGVFLTSGKVRGKNRQQLIQECQRIAEARIGMELSGNPEEDWLQMRLLLSESSAPHIRQVAEDAKFLRLLNRGSALRVSLGNLWRTQGSYAGAETAVKEALLQEHFAAASKDWRGIHLMTIHKAKGKEFDEVLVYEGRHTGRIVPSNADARREGQARLALRVAVTRAIKRTTICTPRSDACVFL